MRTIGSGIFTWCSSERRSGRYGTFFLAPSDFEERVQRDVHLDVAALRALEERNVRIALRILESRPSGRAGDQFLKVFPGTPPAAATIPRRSGSAPRRATDARSCGSTPGSSTSCTTRPWSS